MFSRKKQKIRRPLTRRIINYFIAFGVALIFIFLIAFGYTQTSSFRNWLREFVIEQVNSSTNGKLAIGQLDGTIFTTLVLSNTSYIYEKDTLLTAEKIEIKISPLRVLLKTIYVRKLEIENANIVLLKDENGVLNLSKITNPPEEKVMEETITTTEPFSWKIDVSELNLRNINFKHQSLANKYSTADYPQLNLDDLRLENLNLSLKADINIAANEYQLFISAFSVKPNLYGFNLLNLSGKFVLLKDIAGVVDLNILTERSYILLDAAASDFNPFNNDFDIANSKLKVKLDVEHLNFDDLTNFIEGTNILKGDVSTRLTAEGSLNDLYVKNLDVKLAETNLNASGFLQNITDGDRMRISMNFKNSFINQDDVTNLLPELSIPTYKEYGVLKFDSLSYSGQPLNFTANMLLQTDKGKVSGLASMDLRGEEIIYDYRIKTANLDLMPVTGIHTRLNLQGDLKGKGFSPEDLETNINIRAGASQIEGISFNQFRIDAEGSKGIIKTDIFFKSLETQGDLSSQFDFSDTTSTKYNFDIVLNGFNIADIVEESSITSDLNISFTGDGENFGQDDLNLFAVLEIDSSSLNEIEIDSTVLIADIRSSKENRIINIVSDFADLTITGKYTIPEMVELISEEVNLISSSIKEKIAKIQPPYLNQFADDSTLFNLDAKKPYEILANKNLDIQYLLELKSFELISLFIGNADIEVDGEITGKLFSSADTTYLNLDTNIDQLRYWDGLELYFLYDFNFQLSMMNGPSLNSFDDFYADAKIKAERIFVGSEITNLSFDLNFNNNKAIVALSAVYDAATTIDLNGEFLVNDEIVNVNLNKLKMRYKDFYLENSDDVEFSYSDNKFIFDHFVLLNEQGKLNLNGQLSFDGQENLTLNLSNINLKNISTGILQLPSDKIISGELNLDISMTGTAESPMYDMNLNVDSIKVQNYNLGSIESSVQYSDRLLTSEFNFLDNGKDQPRQSLGLEGTLPIDLSFYTNDRLPSDKEINLTFTSDDFDLRFASSFIPGIRNLVGTLNGEVNLNGNYEDVKNSGELTIDNTSFVLEVTNLTYLLNGSLNFQNDKILISNMNLKNDPSIKNGGIMIVTGQIDHKYFNVEKVDLRASGSIKVLDEKTKAVNPALYGDITVETRNDIVFSSSEERTYLGLDLILQKGANITYSPTQSAFTNENDKFTYLFASQKTGDELEKEIDSLLVLSELKKQEKNLAQRIPFNFDLSLEVQKEAKVVFVLSREFKQNLTAYLAGRLQYSVINEIPFANGELTLLDGSKLDFIKTFQAKGNIRFIEELDDPYINVVATYESFYSPDTLQTSVNEYDVQIRINIEGTAKEISSNFLKGENNIEVYKSRRNANQYELDPSKSSSDAMFFIIVNKFPEDASIQETNLAASTAASLAGSIVGTVLNEKLGDVVRSVNVQQVGTETVFSLVGKVEEFRYEIGGTSQVFQDLTRATVKIEHPLFFPNLVIRFYRTEPPYQSTTYSEMINELGLKYSFVF